MVQAFLSQNVFAVFVDLYSIITYNIIEQCPIFEGLKYMSAFCYPVHYLFHIILTIRM